MALTPYERETIINMNDEDDYALIYSAQRRVINALKKNPAAELIEEFDNDARFKIPAKLVNIRMPRRTAAQARMDPKDAADRMARARAARGK